MPRLQERGYTAGQGQRHSPDAPALPAVRSIQDSYSHQVWLLGPCHKEAQVISCCCSVGVLVGCGVDAGRQWGVELQRCYFGGGGVAGEGEVKWKVWKRMEWVL